MAFRTKQQYRSWNAIALGLKPEPEEPDKIDDSLSRPRRESWSQPPQRGRSVRGRGYWGIDNRPNAYRRHTMPNSNSRDDLNHNYNYRTDDDSNKSNQWEDDNDNPIAEEPSSTSSGSTKENCEFQSCKENFSRVRKYSADNIYRPPKSRSASYISSDNGSYTKYEPKSINNESDQVWTHDKFESLEYDHSDQKDQSDQKDTKKYTNAKNALTPVSSLNINNESLENNVTQEVSTYEFSQKINKPESPKETIVNSEHPDVITINIRELTAKSTNEELKTEEVDLEVVSEVTPKVTPNEPNHKVTPELTPEITPEITPEVNIEANPKVNPELDSKINHEADIEVTPVEELPLINLDEEENTSTQSIQTKISEDILTLDWDSYQKGLMEQELQKLKLLTLERQTIQTTNPRKLDTELMAFDSLL